ncbi:MAG: hypothetical protein AAGF94_18690 [Pseudomonadota bacterium]
MNIDTRTNGSLRKGADLRNDAMPPAATNSKPERHTIIALFNEAMAKKQVLLPNLSLVTIPTESVSEGFDGDVCADPLTEIIKPSYELRAACCFETLVQAGHIGPKGSDRFRFVMEQLSLERATGNLFGLDDQLIDRGAAPKDWRKVEMFCDVFPQSPGHYLHKLKKKTQNPRQQVLNCSTNDALVLRLSFIKLALKIFWARAGYPEFCDPQQYPI